MKIVRKLDGYFLSDDPNEITISDRLTFYGFYITTGIIALMTISKLYGN